MKLAVKYILLIINILAVLTLIGAFIAPMINPTRIPIIAFWGLIMPYSLIINTLFIIYWILKARLYFLISLLAIILSWSTIKTSFPFHKNEDTEVSVKKGLKILSYNVRVFDRYNWSKKKDTTSKMLRFIKEQKADIICLQEFGTSLQSDDGATEKFILNTLREYPHHYIHYTPKSSNKRHQQGLAIFSKNRIAARKCISDFDAKGGFTIYADIELKSEKIRVINTHFESIHLNNKYDITKGIDGDNYKGRIKGVIKSINQAAIQHVKSAENINLIVEKSPYPVLICADMNNTPVSYSYHTLKQNLEDAFLQQGTGFGATYNGTYPFLRIDYIFHSKQLEVIEYKRRKVKFSDHFPIAAEFLIAN